MTPVPPSLLLASVSVEQPSVEDPRCSLHQLEVVFVRPAGMGGARSKASTVGPRCDHKNGGAKSKRVFFSFVRTQIAQKKMENPAETKRAVHLRRIGP